MPHHLDSTPYHHSSPASYTSQLTRSQSSASTRGTHRHPHAPLLSSAQAQAPQSRSSNSTSASSSSTASSGKSRMTKTAEATITYNPSSHVFPGKPLPPVAALIGHGNGHTASSANGKGSPLPEMASSVRNSSLASHHYHAGAGGAGSSSHQSRAGSVSDAISMHSQASTSTTGNSMYRNATYSPPPGLSIETEADDYLGPHDFGHEESLQKFVSSNAIPTRPQPPSSLPRSARIDQSSSIPAAAQWLLSTSPPTVRRAASTSSSSRPASHSANGRPSSSYSILQNGSSSSKILSPQRSYELDSTSNSEYSGYSSTSSGKGLSWGKKSLSSVFGLGPRRQNSRPEPKPITLQLSRPNPNRSGRLDSATLPVEVPKVWDDWIKQYANGGMDVENPPRPPPPMASNTFPTLHASFRSSRNPAEESKLSAPNQPFESVRQKMIARLELFGPTEITSARTALRMVTPIASSSSSQFTQGTDRNSSLFDRRASNGSTAQSSVSAMSSESTPAFLNSAGFDDVPESPSCLSFANHPSLASILRRAKNTFGVRIVLVTVLLEDKQRFLAATGMPKGVESLPREVTFCAHTVLNGERGLVVLDTQRDWRFRNNVLSVSVNARLYAGMPIYPPSNAELEEEAGGRLPIGTLCLLDDRPRTEFTQSERAQLRALASDVSVEIEAWFSELRSSVVPHSSSMADLSHNQAKQVAFDEPSPSSGYTDWNGLNTPVASTFPNSSPSKIEQSPASVSSIKPALKCRPNNPATYMTGSLSSHVPQALPPMPEKETARHLHTGRSQKIKPRTKPEIPVRDVRRSALSPGVNPATSSPELSASFQNVSPTFIRQAFSSAKTRPQPRTPHQKLLDSATKSLGDRLALSLVYLVSMSNLSEEGPHALALLSAHNLPATTPSFDSALHLKALRAVEGGLLYRNPAIATLGPNDPGFASGILLPVAEREGMGWVLAGYTKDATRVFSEEELDRFVDVSAQLAQLVAGDPSTMDAEL